MPAVGAFFAGVGSFLTTGVVAGAGIGGAWAAGAATASFLTTNIIGRLLTSVALSALSQAVLKPRGQKAPGIRSPNTTRGDVNPESFIIGRYATAGSYIAPPYTHSRSGHKTPNPYLQYIIHLGGAPRQRLVGLLVDGRTTEILGEEIHWDGSTNFGGSNDWAGKRREYGREVRIEGSGDIRCWVRFADGTQTQADGRLVNRYGNHGQRPWASDMIGTGICYAVVTFQLESSIFSGFPQVQFVMDGIPLYDPRKDSTAGGDGAHRWGQPSTYERTENPAVQIYNVLRGISLPGGRIYGGRARARQLPSSSWFAGMNACDASVALAGGGSEKAWRASYEISVADKPNDVVRELCSAASIQLTEMGGTWKIRVGAPGVPVAWLTDDDVLSSKELTFDMFPGIGQTYNGASISFPDPQSGWQTAEGPIYIRADYAAQDQGRELVADLSLPAAPYQAQNQRLARAYVEEERRFRRHVITLPPDYGVLEPLDAIAWTSRNGYEDKIFEVVQTATDPVTQLVTASLRERDPEDYDWEPGFQLPYTPTPPQWSGPVQIEVGDFRVYPLIISDTNGRARRPAIELTWNTDDLEDVDGLEWEVRLSGASTVQLRGSASDVRAGRLVIAEGIIPNTAYQVHARFVGKAFDVIWSSWLPVISPDVRIGAEDLSDGLKEELSGERDTTPPGKPTNLVLTSSAAGETVKLFADWAANSEADMLGYIVGIKEADGVFITFQTRENHHEWTVTGGQSYTVRVQAIDTSNNLSLWSDQKTLVAARDTVPPPVPTGVSATPGIGTILLKWGNVAANDLATYEVFESGSTTAPTAATAASYSSAGNLVSVTGYTGEVTRYFWVRAVDTSGNKSAWSTRVSAKTVSGETVITTEKLKGLIDQTSFAQGLSAPEVVFALPAAPHTFGRLVVLMTDGKLYRNTGSGWTRAVDGADLLSNSIVTAALAAGAVKTPQLDAGAVTASKMLIGSTENIIRDPEYYDLPGYWATNSAGATYGVAGGQSTETNGQDRVLTLRSVVPGPSAWTRMLASPLETAKAGEEYFLAAAMWTNADTRVILRITFKDQDGSYIGGVNALNGPPSGSGSRLYMASGAAPPGTRFMHFEMFINRSYPCDYNVGRIAIRTRFGGELIVDGGIRGRNLAVDEAVITVAAQIASAIINDAHIENLSAAKLRTGTALAGTLTVSGEALTSIRGKAAQGAQDPAIRINQGSTTIDPGMILVSGGTRLSDWRAGGDNTKIKGGAMELNSLKAEHLQIGLRNITLTGIQFEHNSPANNRASWSAGVIRWTNDAGGNVSTNIAAGSTGTWSSGVFYIYWVKGETSFRITTSLGTAFGDDTVILATYEGGIKLDADYGRTIIDGSGIKSKSITAQSGAIGDLAVDTLQIAGNAVSVSAFADAPDNVFFVGRTNLASVSINRTGGYSTAISLAFAYRSPADTNIAVTLYRGSTLIRTWYASNQQKTFLDVGMFSVSTVDDNTGSGATNYSLQVQRVGSSVGSAAEASLAFISATQFKR